jgi:hypothetical protein
MSDTITLANIVEKVELGKCNLSKLKDLLLLGNLLDFESDLGQVMEQLYSSIVLYFMSDLWTEPAYISRINVLCKVLNMNKLSKRKTTLQLSNGHRISYMDYYANEVESGYVGERFMSHLLYKNVHKVSLLYASRVSELSVLTPSFCIGQQVLSGLGIKSNSEKNRMLSLELGNLGIENRVANMLEVGENVIDKRVIIGIDGGRTRTRVWEESEDVPQSIEEQGAYGKFKTPWIEPKLVVINILDNEGKVEKKRLPIYDVSFGDDEIFALLKDYLSALQIDKAQSVQVVADGATWIWNRAKSMLVSLGVQEEKIVETLDYYHAVKHLNDLKVELPEETQNQTIKAMKDALWVGDVKRMKTLFNENRNMETAKIDALFAYFDKNIDRINYQKYKENKYPVGSGIVESAIRRVINLRFKCPSSFWNKENLQPLFFLRAVFLTGRKNIFLANLNKNPTRLQI